MNEMNSKRLVSKRLVSKQLVSKRLVKKDDIDEKLAQADVSSLHREAVISVIIIARWRLHVHVCTFGESTEMKAHCIVIQGMPTGNSRKSRDTTNGRSKTSGHQAFKEITAGLLLITEFNEMSMTALHT